MTTTSPDLPRPKPAGLSPVAYDGAHNHREVAKTSSRRRTEPSTPTARLQSVRCHRSNHARPRLHAPNARQPHPRRACNCTERDRQGDCGRPYQDHGCRPAVAGRRGQIRATGTDSRISGGSKRDCPTPSLTAGSRGSDPRPLGPTMGGRPDRTCGERPRASRIATRPKVGPTNCEKNISGRARCESARPCHVGHRC